MVRFWGVLLFLLAQSGLAWGAANTSLSIIINGPPATTVSCTIKYPSGQTGFTAPVAAGTQMAACTVAPTGWSGALTIDPSSPDKSYFSLSGMNVVSAVAITAPRTYTITINANP